MLIHWQCDPVLISLGPLAIRWYGLLFAAPFLVGQYFFARVFREEGIPEKNIDQLMVLAVLGTVIGARLAHCLFYDPDYYFANPLEILAIWEGGLASHGGIAGLVCGFWLAYSKFSPRVHFLWLLDRLAIPGALGAVCIRLGNFMNSEIIGVPTSGNWGVVFELVDGIPRHPAQLYESFGYALTLGVLVWQFVHYRKRPPHGIMAGTLLALIFLVRILVEFVKTPQAVYEAGQVFSVGQYLSVPFLLVGLALVWRALAHPSTAALLAAPSTGRKKIRKL